MTNSAENLRSALRALAKEKPTVADDFANLSSASDLEFLLYDWQLWARPEQLPPLQNASASPWLTWLFLGGRGAGKTRAGAEWIRALALGLGPAAGKPVGRMALIGETYATAREVMLEGESGLMGVHPPHQRPNYIASRRRLEWPNGAVAELYSAEDPEALRGPQFGAAWLDELGKWDHARETWDMLQFALRLGDWPRQLVTTTPRSIPLLRDLLEDESCCVSRASTSANQAHLAPGFLKTVMGRYGGTRMGRQEIEGELLVDREDALWQRDLLERTRARPPEKLARIVIAVDPPAGGKSGVCGLMVAGVDDAGTAFVLEDASLSQPRPETWVRKASELYHAYEADALIVETNQGGDMVEALFRSAHPEIPIRPVRAVRGKRLRAEPVAELYSRGRVKHAHAFPALEDQLSNFGLDGLANGRSPDRVDALVWAIAALLLQPAGEPRIRSF